MKKRACMNACRRWRKKSAVAAAETIVVLDLETHILFPERTPNYDYMRFLFDPPI